MSDHFMGQLGWGWSHLFKDYKYEMFNIHVLIFSLTEKKSARLKKFMLSKYGCNSKESIVRDHGSNSS